MGKKNIALFMIIPFLIVGCVSYVPISTEKPASIEGIAHMNKLGVIVLLDIKESGHLMVSQDGSSNENTLWDVDNYSEFDGSVVISVTDDTIRNSYLDENKAAEIVATAAAEVLGNGLVYEYAIKKSYSAKSVFYSNQKMDATGNPTYIKAADVVPIQNELDYKTTDKELIPFAVKAGKENNIEGLIILYVTLIAEAGNISSFNSDATSGYPMSDGMEPIYTEGDFFARSSISIDKFFIMDAKTGAFVAKIDDNISENIVLNAHEFYKLENMQNYTDLKRYFQNGNFENNVKDSAIYEVSVLIPYLRPHWYTYYQEVEK